MSIHQGVGGRQETAYLAQGIKDMVKILEYLSLGDFGNVVHGLACIVPNSCILVGEASQHRGDDDLEITREFLGQD